MPAHCNISKHKIITYLQIDVSYLNYDLKGPIMIFPAKQPKDLKSLGGPTQ